VATVIGVEVIIGNLFAGVGVTGEGKHPTSSKDKNNTENNKTIILKIIKLTLFYFSLKYSS
jgi:hypothetical protein